MKFVVQLQLGKIATGAVHAGEAIFVGPFDTGAQGGEFFSASGLGDSFRNNVVSGFF